MKNCSCVENLRLRPVTPEDKEFVFQLANDPLVRAMSFHSELIAWETHCRWFQQVLDKHLAFYIAEASGQTCGYVRFAPDGNEIGADTEGQNQIMSIAVAPMWRGRCIGEWLVNESCSRLMTEYSVSCIHAWVKEENTASLRVFAKAGFVVCERAVQYGCSALHAVRKRTSWRV